jgi:hypothetical protein
MAMCYWVCEGIGVEQSELLPLLDGDKLKGLFVGFSEDEWENDYGFSALSNEKKVEAIMDFVNGSDFDGKLPELLKQRDSKGVLSCGNDNDGLYFLLYHPRYPWDESGGFTSKDEVIRYIYELIKPYCKDDISEIKLLGIIDDVYAPGCG